MRTWVRGVELGLPAVLVATLSAWPQGVGNCTGALGVPAESARATPDDDRVGQCGPAGPVSTGRKDDSSRLTIIYDRVAQRSRVIAAPGQVRRSFGLGSTATFYAFFTYEGRLLKAPPEEVTLVVEGRTPSRGGWAFGHAQQLEITFAGAAHLAIPGSDYRRYAVRLLDLARHESLSFSIPTADFVAMARSPAVELHVGGWRMKLNEGALAALRELAGRLTSDRRTALGD